MIGPIVQSRGVKVSARGPDQRANFWVELYLSELLGIPQWAKKLSLEHRLKVDRPSQPVLERNCEHVGSDLFKALDAVNWMSHGFNLMQGSDRCRAAAILEQLPVCQKFILMQFCPSFNQALLSLRKCSGKQRDWSNAEDGSVLLIIRMEVTRVMPLSRLYKHPDDNAIKPREFRHARSVPARDQPRKWEGRRDDQAEARRGE
jgi:hypothetical protein